MYGRYKELLRMIVVGVGVEGNDYWEGMKKKEC